MQPLTEAHKAFLRQTVTNAEQLIADLEREATSEHGADISRFMAGMYAAFGMGAPTPITKFSEATTPPAETPDESDEEKPT